MRHEATTARPTGRTVASLAFSCVVVLFAAGPLGLWYTLEHFGEWWAELASSFAYSGSSAKMSPHPQPSSRELPVVEIDRVASEAVVLISSENGQGSAVVIAPTLLLSACHVGQQNVTAFPVGGSPVHLRLEANRLLDRCVFKSDRQLSHIVPGVRQSATLVPLERVYAYGFPSKMPTLSSGVFLDVYVDEDGTRLLRTTARVAPGNSGGALFDRFGNLIGVIRAVSGDRKTSFSLIADEWWER
jgi:S1-C subfamily serine protease